MAILSKPIPQGIMDYFCKICAKTSFCLIILDYQCVTLIVAHPDSPRSWTVMDHVSNTLDQFTGAQDGFGVRNTSRRAEGVDLMDLGMGS